MDVKENRQLIIGGIVLVVVLVAGWWLFTGKKADTTMQDDTTTPSGQVTTSTESTSSSTTEVPTVVAEAGEAVTVTDQPAGDSVRVAEARLSRVSWIAVRDDRSILGAARVTPPEGGGTMGDITVPLLRNTETGMMYKIVVYVDDGDQIFDFKVDAIVNGLGTSFTALNGD
jgi:hypothetical protein